MNEIFGTLSVREQCNDIVLPPRRTRYNNANRVLASRGFLFRVRFEAYAVRQPTHVL
jgi:hypothetical protein